MRAKSRANKSLYTKRVYVKQVDKLPYTKVPFASGRMADDVNCVNCGWPLKTTNSVLRAGQNPDGSKRFAHAMCPSLSERKRLRAEALEQG